MAEVRLNVSGSIASEESQSSKSFGAGRHGADMVEAASKHLSHDKSVPGSPILAGSRMDFPGRLSLGDSDPLSQVLSFSPIQIFGNSGSGP